MPSYISKRRKAVKRYVSQSSRKSETDREAFRKPAAAIGAVGKCLAEKPVI